MYRRYCIYGVAAISALGLLLVAQPGFSTSAPAAERVENPHDYSNKEACKSCHAKSMPALRFDSVTVCTRCHAGFLGNHPVAKHPIGKRPSINITRLMPLSSDDKMVCYTCHDNHNKTNYKSMLRTDYLHLCSSCHRGY